MANFNLFTSISLLICTEEDPVWSKRLLYYLKYIYINLINNICLLLVGPIFAIFYEINFSKKVFCFLFRYIFKYTHHSIKI